MGAKETTENLLDIVLKSFCVIFIQFVVFHVPHSGFDISDPME